MRTEQDQHDPDLGGRSSATGAEGANSMGEVRFQHHADLDGQASPWSSRPRASGLLRAAEIRDPR